MADISEAKEQQQSEQGMLDRWKRQFEIDRNAKKIWDTKFDQYEQYYTGKHTFGNLSPIGLNNEDRKVRTNVNFIRMAIEALIDLSVPDPDLTAVAPDDENPVKLLNDYVKYVCRKNPLEEINLENERIVKKFGGGFYKIRWDNGIKQGMYVGDIEIDNPHPKLIIPNAGALNWADDLEHYHHVLNKTERYILKRWPDITKEDLEDKAILYTEYDEINSDDHMWGSEGRDESGASDSNLKRYSIIETTFKDRDGDLAKMWWSGDLLLEYTPKFYWHRDTEGNPTRTETLDVGAQIRTGTNPDTGNPVYRSVEQQTDPDTGELMFDDNGQPLGEEVEYYIPTSWDLIYQPYLPRDLCCWGTSIVDDIADLDEAIRKAVFAQEEGFLKGRRKIITDNENDKTKLEDPYSSVVCLTGNVRDVDMTVNIDGISWINTLKDWIQLLTGATNAAMGVHDAGVKSAKQTQILVSQANYKANLAATYKSIAFKQIFKVVTEFAMAFCDDDRPFRISGQTKNDNRYGTFSRLSLLRDDSGNIVYPDWDVTVSTQSGWLQNKSEIMNNIVMLANNKNFEPTEGNLNYLKILQRLGMPYLDSVIQNMEVTVDKRKKIA